MNPYLMSMMIGPQQQQQQAAPNPFAGLFPGTIATPQNNLWAEGMLGSFSGNDVYYGPTAPEATGWAYVGDTGGYNPRGSSAYGQNTFGASKMWRRTTPTQDKPASAEAAAPAQAAPTPQPQAAAQLPALNLPDVDVRQAGLQIGIQRAESTSRKNKNINKGTSQLRIPRSAGASSLTIA